MEKIIKYLGHEFIFIMYDNSWGTYSYYAEYKCGICGVEAAVKYITFKWYYQLWKPLDLTCNEITIKKLIE